MNRVESVFVLIFCFVRLISEQPRIRVSVPPVESQSSRAHCCCDSGKSITRERESNTNDTTTYANIRTIEAKTFAHAKSIPGVFFIFFILLLIFFYIFVAVNPISCAPKSSCYASRRYFILVAPAHRISDETDFFSPHFLFLSAYSVKFIVQDILLRRHSGLRTKDKSDTMYAEDEHVTTISFTRWENRPGKVRSLSAACKDNYLNFLHKI